MNYLAFQISMNIVKTQTKNRMREFHDTLSEMGKHYAKAINDNIEITINALLI